MKRILWVLSLFLLLFAAAENAYAYSGSGGIWAQAKGDFISRNFKGDSTGFGLARDYCLGKGGGVIQVGPGLETVTLTYPSNSNLLVLRSFITGWSADPQFGASDSGMVYALRERSLQPVYFAGTNAGIQAALDYVGATGGGYVGLGVGNYLISNLKIWGHTVLEGRNSAETNLIRIAGSTGPALREYTIPEGNTDGATHVTIRHIRFSGNNTVGNGIDLGNGLSGLGTDTQALNSNASLVDVLVRDFQGIGFKLCTNTIAIFDIHALANTTGLQTSYNGANGDGGSNYYGVWAEHNTGNNIIIGDNGNFWYGVHVEETVASNTNPAIQLGVVGHGGQNHSFSGVNIFLQQNKTNLISMKSGLSGISIRDLKVTTYVPNTWTNTFYHEGWGTGIGQVDIVSSFSDGRIQGSSEYGNNYWWDSGNNNYTTVTGASFSLIASRLGPNSTATTGGALRIVDGSTFPLTIAGVQAALDECATVGGGTVLVPAQAGISVTTTTLKIPNRTRLLGLGSTGSTGTFVCSSTCNVGAVIENKDIDGSQQYAAVENISIIGSVAGGATDSVGIRFRSVFVMSLIRDVLVNNMKGKGILIDDPGNHGCGPLELENIWINNVQSDGIHFDGSVGRINNPHMYAITVERWGTGKAAIRLQGKASGNACIGGLLHGLYMEEANDATADGLVVTNWSNFSAENIFTNGSGTMNLPVRIEGATGAVFGSYNCSFKNVYAGTDTILYDIPNNVGFTTSNGRGLYEYRTPSKSYTQYPLMVVSDTLRVGQLLDVSKRGSVQDSFRINKGLYVGGQFVNKILRASATLDFDLSAATQQDLTITVTGAAVGDEVFLGIPNGSISNNILYYAWVSSANTVTVRALQTLGNPNPASGTFKVTVLQ